MTDDITVTVASTVTKRSAKTSCVNTVTHACT